jgi:uncharacterized protein YyaL (SSP411 family)
MSYDNSELLRAYLDAASAFDSALFRATAADTAAWVRDVLADPAGGYGGSQDADVGLDDDGDYFTWTYDEAAAVLSPDELEVAAAYYDIGTAGEMHHNPGKNVLFVAAPADAIAVRLKTPVAEVTRLLESAEQKLRAARAERPAPFVDRTRYTNWNAMMAGAMLKAGIVLEQEWAVEHALQTLTRIREENEEPDAVAHSPGGVRGLLDDQVNVALAAIDAWETTGDATWLDWSVAIMDRVWRDYLDGERGGLFDTVPSAEKPGLLPLPSKPVQDAPTPSPNGVAGLVLARLYEHTMDEKWRERRDALINAFAGKAGELGLHGATFLLAIDWTLHPAAHLVIVGPAGDAEAEKLHRRALTTFLPRKVVRRLTDAPAGGRALPPALAGMVQGGQGTRAYLCIGATCQLPVGSDAEWKELLGQARSGAVTHHE